MILEWKPIKRSIIFIGLWNEDENENILPKKISTHFTSLAPEFSMQCACISDDIAGKVTKVQSVISILSFSQKREHSKGQLISKQNFRAVTFPKKQMKRTQDSILNVFRSFFARSYGSTILFLDLLTFTTNGRFSLVNRVLPSGNISWIEVTLKRQILFVISVKWYHSYLPLWQFLTKRVKKGQKTWRVRLDWSHW